MANDSGGNTPRVALVTGAAGTIGIHPRQIFHFVSMLPSELK